MAFVHLALLAGLALGAVPILIHLLTRRRHKIVRWGAMKYLLAAIEETSRRVQIEDLILMALRALAVCLIAFALARPFIRGQEAPQGPRLAVVLIDNSPSMTSQRGSVSRWDLARRWAKELLADLPAGSAVAVVPMAGPAGSSAGLAEPTRQIALAGKIIDDLAISARRSDPAAALRAAGAIVTASDLVSRTVYVISDFQAIDWRAAGSAVPDELTRLARLENTSLVAVQCSGGERDNVAITELERTLRIIKVDSPARITAVLTRHGNGGGPHNVTATLHVDRAKVDSRSAPVAAEQSRPVVYFATMDKEGDHAVELRSAPDICPADDVRYLAVEAREEVRVLCVDGDPHPDEDFLSETFYLRFALSPGAGALSPINAKIITVDEFGAEDLKNYDLVVLANVGRLEPTRARDLAAYLRSGRAAMVFLADMVEPESYNATLFGGPDLLLAARLGQVLEAPGGPLDGGGFRADMGTLAGEIMPYFKGDDDGGFAAARFNKAFDIDLSAAAKSVQVHARLSNGQPLLFSTQVGEGRLAVINSSADVGWANLPLKPAFTAMVQRLVVWLLEPRSRCQNLGPGEKYRLSLPLAAINTTVTVKMPDSRTAAIQPVAAGEHAVVEFANTTLAGFYEVSWTGQAGPEQRLFSVNIDPAESDLATIDSDSLRELASGSKLGSPIAWRDVTGPTAGVQAARRGGGEFWRWILLAALAVLGIETYLSRRFSGGTKGK